MEVKTGYKMTEVGVIPKDWDAVPLGELGKFKNGINKNSECFGHGSPFVNLMDVFGVSRIVSNDALGLVATNASEQQTYNLRKGDMVFIRSSVKPSGVGLTAVVEEDLPETVYSGFLIRYRDNGKLSDAFKRHCFFEEGFRRRVIGASSVSANTNINQDNLKRLPLAVPPTHAEQEAIAEVLSDADALIESLEQLLAKKCYLKQGAIQKLLRPQQGAEVRLLREVSTLKGRIGWQGLKQTEFTDNEDEPFLITGMNFKDGAIRWNEVYHISEARYDMAPEIQLKVDDVLMTKDGTIGKVLYIDTIPYPGKASLNSHLLLFRPIRGSYNPKYLYYQLGSQRFKDFIELSKSGTTFFGISQAAVGAYPLLLPPMAAQAQIAETLSDMDAEIAELEGRLIKARQIKQGMMQELLTGKIRLVRPASNVVPFPLKKASTPTPAKSHNWQINEAVIIAVLAKHFGSEQWPLARKRCTKLTYLLHRHAEHNAEGYLKKAAGPYNPDTRYKGPETIAQRNGYVCIHNNGSYEGFVAADNIAVAESYFEKWYGPDALEWLERFRFKKNDELELLTTVDFAVEELSRDEKAIKLDTVKKVIRDHPEWKAKLDREVFCDSNINRAIQSCRELFAD